MRLYGNSTHWRFALVFDQPYWCFGWTIRCDGLFIFFWYYSFAVWRQQRAIP